MVSRAHPRYAIAVDVNIVVGATHVNGRTENISSGGLCAELDRAIPIGEGIVAKLALVFPNQDIDAVSESIEVGGRVVWCTQLGEGFQVGIQFTNVTADAQNDLRLFLRFLAARP